jgi:hypothetical protein
MKHLLNKQSSRQLALLELLWKNDWLTISEIVKEIGGVEKTIRTDIKQLNGMIEPLKIETSFKYGVFLNKDLRISKSYIYSIFLQKSIECKMLEAIFIDPMITKGELCDQLFISETQLNRLHTKLNILMKKYEIQITNDLKLIGNEKNIRKFFSSLFYEMYLSLDFLLKKEEFQLIDIVLNRFYKKNKDKMVADDQHYLLLNKMRIKIWVAVYRCKFGDCSNEKLPPFDYSMITKDNKLKEQWQQVFGIELTEQVLFNLFDYFHAPFKLNEDLTQIGTSQLLLKEKFEKLLLEVSQELMINCCNQEALIQAILCSGIRAIGPTFILNNVEEDFVLEPMKERQDIVLIVKEKLHIIYEELLLPLADKNNMLYQSIYTLMSQWPEFRAEIRKPMIKIKAALLLDIPAGHLKMLKEEIEYHFRNTYEVDILPPLEQNLSKQLTAYDCILTNGFDNSHIENVKIIGVPNYFGEEFVKKLHSFLINKKEELNGFRKNIFI